MRWPPWSSHASSCSSLSCRTCPGAWAWILSPLATCRRPWVCFSCWAGRCLAGSRTSAGRGPRSPSLSWRPPPSTCSWRPPAPRGCRGWLCSSPRACPARSCTRCQVGPAAQMVITDLTTPEERPTALSRLGLCVGSGTILGSLLGGTLSTACGIQCPVLVAFVANLLGAILSFTYIPANTKGAGAHGPAAPPGGPQASVFDLKTITRLLLQPGVLPVFLVKVVCGFPFGLFMVMFSIINMEFFQLEPAQASYLQSFFGILMMVIQGLLIGRLSRRFSEGALLWASVLVFCLVGLAMPVHSQHSHRQHADQGRLGLGHGDHAGPLRLCAAADPHHRAHPGWPPVPQIWRPRLRPRAVRRQLPCPPGPVEATDTPPGGEQSQVTLAPEHRLAINPLGTASGLISAGLPASRLGGGLGLRDGAWNAGGLPGGGACSWVPGFREGNITQVPPAPWSPSPRPMRSTLSASPEHPAPTPQPH
ncbi:solute carrier family 67 member A1 isoform X2 [Pteropus medius]|uniref:solute carrier family 22 member 18 isoform X2 n=1 Tax=Pteropus vampyrus TaxID=132908 RepID=UPI00196A9DD3|nr:solute carrier family 22 member 18 isoform X2 [Pteropus giganteus]